jgi:fused signal recognition particle receptor
MFSFFKKKKPADAAPSTPRPSDSPAPSASGGLIGSALVTPIEIALPGAVPAGRAHWVSKLKSGLQKTGASISGVFTGKHIDDALYEDLESALLMADAGVSATAYLLGEVKRRVKDSGVTHPVAVKNILTEVLTQLLQPL